MNFKSSWSVVFLSHFSAVSTGKINTSTTDQRSAPFLGWNSYDFYEMHIDDVLL